MSQDLNRVELRGTVSEAPQSRSKAGGTDRIVTLRVATVRRYKQADEWREFTSWHRVVCFAHNADIAGLLSKDDKVAIEGELQTRKFDSGDGKPGYITEVAVGITGFIAKLSYETGDSRPRPQRHDSSSHSAPSIPAEDDDENQPPF